MQQPLVAKVRIDLGLIDEKPEVYALVEQSAATGMFDLARGGHGKLQWWEVEIRGWLHFGTVQLAINFLKAVQMLLVLDSSLVSIQFV